MRSVAIKFSRVFIILLALASPAIQAAAADIERGQRVNDETIKKDVQAKISDLFPSRTVEVIRIDEINLPVLREYKLLRITVDDRELLEHSILPDGGTFGMFAHGQGKLLYLNLLNDNLEKLLWEDRQARVEAIDPEVLARVLILCKISKGTTYAHLMRSTKIF